MLLQPSRPVGIAGLYCWSVRLWGGQPVVVELSAMARVMPLLLGGAALVLAVVPTQAAQNCGPDAHWVQTGSALGAGYCKPKGRRDHQVCAIGYHYAGKGVCRRNGPWWTGPRPIEWGHEYRPGDPKGSLSFEGPHGGRIQLRW